MPRIFRADAYHRPLAYGAFGDAADLDAARGVHRYLRDFLRSPSGAFRASQDADVVRGEHAGEYFARDDAGRGAAGMPRPAESPSARLPTCSESPTRCSASRARLRSSAGQRQKIVGHGLA